MKFLTLSHPRTTAIFVIFYNSYRRCCQEQADVAQMVCQKNKLIVTFLFYHSNERPKHCYMLWYGRLLLDIMWYSWLLLDMLCYAGYCLTFCDIAGYCLICCGTAGYY